MKEQNTWLTYTPEDLDKIETLSKGYIQFLNQGKTERECVREIITMAEENGYANLADLISSKKTLTAGDKFYAQCMDKTIILFNLGTEDIEQGMNILGAHIDSPRLDVKQNPLYENSEFAYLDTHYYGGIKKYQWVTLPLALHGVVVKKDGSKVNISIGENPDDPVFFISDLLIHLAADQLDKKASVVIEGEQLDVLFGSIPLEDSEKEPVKQNILKLLKETYDLEENDFWSAELEIVPAGSAREAGLDRSMILAYGQDDRVCAYTS
ncbi:MAG: aminopeptidase, partial [Anaerovoracaceae bacterium]